MPTPLELLVAVPFDHPVFAEPDDVGAVLPIKIGAARAALEVPRARDPAGNLGLVRPASAPEDFADYLPEKMWGLAQERMPYVELRAVLIVMPVVGNIDASVTGSALGGPGLTEALTDVRRWFEGFNRWLWALTAQSIHPMHPDPKVLHRKSYGMLSAGRTADGTSLTVADAPPTPIVLDLGNAASERVLDRATLELAAQYANDSVPLIVEMSTSARMAARRGDARRAFIDCGTAAEGALVRVLNLPDNHGKTLGPLVAAAIAGGHPVPADTQTALVGPRNDAAHRGVLRPGANVLRAIEIVDSLVALVEPEFVRQSTLRTVNRPQRHDMMIIRRG
jgi:hypothetical protein